jgi:hypothetical protein
LLLLLRCIRRTRHIWSTDAGTTTVIAVLPSWFLQTRVREEKNALVWQIIDEKEQKKTTTAEKKKK